MSEESERGRRGERREDERVSKSAKRGRGEEEEKRGRDESETNVGRGRGRGEETRETGRVGSGLRGYTGGVEDQQRVGVGGFNI